MNEITPFLGIMDFVPITTMFIGFLILYHNLKNKITKNYGIMFITASIIILVSAGVKATHKTIIGLTGTDIEFMYQFFWVGMAFGCMFLFITLIRIEKYLKASYIGENDTSHKMLYATMPFKPIFMLLEAIGLFGSYIMMLRWAIKLKNKLGIILFAISLILVPVQMRLGQIFTDTSAFHWIGQTVNFMSAFLFTTGVYAIKNKLNNLPEALQKKNR